MKSDLEDYISLSSTSRTEDNAECDVLLLSASDDEPEPQQLPKPDRKPIFSLLKSSSKRRAHIPAPEPTSTPSPPPITKHIKPFIPKCNRVTTHFSNSLTTPSPGSSDQSKVSQLSLTELMSAPDLTSPTKRYTEDPLEQVERVNKLLAQSVIEKGTLQGYIDTLQKKLAVAEAAVKVNNVKCSDTQTEDTGFPCPTCKTYVDPHHLASSLGPEFKYSEELGTFTHTTSGFQYNPRTSLYHCAESSINYYFDTKHSIYHYHSKSSTKPALQEEKGEEEEEGELTEQSLTESLTSAAQQAMTASGLHYIPSLNMYFNDNTGLHYCQSSGLYFDASMSNLYTLENGTYHYHSTSTPKDTNLQAQTSIRAIVKDTKCHKVSKGMLYVFTCMGGSVGREGSHVAVFPELLVSKRHATVSFCTGKYYVLDEGTMNGTYLNKERLSIQKEVSERFELSHLDELKIGSTTLQLHIHRGHDTCAWCEPGLSTAQHEGSSSVISEPPTLYKQRTKEVNRLKRKYKLMGQEQTEVKGTKRTEAS